MARLTLMGGPLDGDFAHDKGLTLVDINFPDDLRHQWHHYAMHPDDRKNHIPGNDYKLYHVRSYFKQPDQKQA